MHSSVSILMHSSVSMCRTDADERLMVASLSLMSVEQTVKVTTAGNRLFKLATHLRFLGTEKPALHRPTKTPRIMQGVKALQNPRLRKVIAPTRVMPLAGTD
jgi:hypothetical protein